MSSTSDDFLLRHGDFTIFKMADFRHMNFKDIMGYLKSPYCTLYRSSLETITLNGLVFEKITFLYVFWWRTDRRTDRQPDALRRSRCRGRRLNNRTLHGNTATYSYFILIYISFCTELTNGIRHAWSLTRFVPVIQRALFKSELDTCLIASVCPE